MTFTNLKLSEKVLAAIEAAGYTAPTPIQAQAIPFALDGRDVDGFLRSSPSDDARERPRPRSHAALAYS